MRPHCGSRSAMEGQACTRVILPGALSATQEKAKVLHPHSSPAGLWYTRKTIPGALPRATREEARFVEVQRGVGVQHNTWSLVLASPEKARFMRPRSGPQENGGVGTHMQHNYPEP